MMSRMNEVPRKGAQRTRPPRQVKHLSQKSGSVFDNTGRQAHSLSTARLDLRERYTSPGLVVVAVLVAPIVVAAAVLPRFLGAAVVTAPPSRFPPPLVKGSPRRGRSTKTGRRKSPSRACSPPSRGEAAPAPPSIASSKASGVATSWTLPLGVREVDDELASTDIRRPEGLGGALRRLRARHRDEAESALSAVGIRRQVDTNDLAVGDPVDQDLDLLLGAVVREVPHVQRAVWRRSSSSSRAPGSRASACAEPAGPRAWAGTDPVAA